MGHALEVRGLSTQIRAGGRLIRAVSSVDFHVDPGETLCLVGESGCGKSMTGLSLMGLLPPNASVVAGSIRLDGRELVGLADQQMARLRGNDIAMIFQDSMTSLNPTKTVGYQVAEPVRRHLGLSRRAARVRTEEVLALAGISQPRTRMSNYPHELSGGLRQRVMIAMALTCEPKVLIADEPTTALDVTIQHQILQLLDELKARLGMAILLITHDMGVVARSADRVNVMYAGRMVESGPTSTMFAGARHPYTRGLLASIPRLDHDRTRLLSTISGMPPDLSELTVGCPFAARCAHSSDRCLTHDPELVGTGPHRFACWHPREPGSDSDASTAHAGPQHEANDDLAPLTLTSIVKDFHPRRSSRMFGPRTSLSAVADVSLAVRPGETVGLVGESGCGKTTLARTSVGLESPTSGDVMVLGERIFSLPNRLLRRRRRNIQMMFQDPYSSLDPRMRVGAILREPLILQRVGTRRDQDDLVLQALSEVGLPPDAVERFPHEFSGGQRQRLGLARAMILKPKLIVADEPVSALDVSVRSQVLNLMKRVQATHGLSFLVISHDLTVIKYLADRVGVMYLGKLVELAPSDQIYERPIHPYTASLLAAIPIPDPDVERSKSAITIAGEVPSAIDPPSGCRFRTRCPRAEQLCATHEPPLREFGDGQLAACHFPLREPESATP